MPLSAPEYWLEWTKNYFRCQFTHVGELIHKETWSAASFGWAEGLQMINPPIYRLTTAVSDIDQTNINRDIRDGNWLSTEDGLTVTLTFIVLRLYFVACSGLDLTWVKGASSTLNTLWLTLLWMFWRQKNLIVKRVSAKKGCLDKETCRKLFGATR